MKSISVKKPKTSHIILIGLVAIVSFVAGATDADRKATEKYDTILKTKIDYKIPQELMASAKRIGMTNQQLIDTNAQIGAEPSSCTAPGLVLGCYNSQTDTIRVYVTSFTRGEADRTLAYEYFHHVWDKELTTGRRDQLTLEVRTLYTKLAPSNPALRHEVETLASAEGGFDSPTISNELGSVACTEVEDTELTPVLLNYCNQYVTNRGALDRNY